MELIHEGGKTEIYVCGGNLPHLFQSLNVPDTPLSLPLAPSVSYSLDLEGTVSTAELSLSWVSQPSAISKDRFSLPPHQVHLMSPEKAQAPAPPWVSRSHLLLKLSQSGDLSPLKAVMEMWGNPGG